MGGGGNEGKIENIGFPGNRVNWNTKGWIGNIGEIKYFTIQCNW